MAEKVNGWTSAVSDHQFRQLWPGDIVASSLLDLAARCQLKCVLEYMERAVDLSQAGGVPFAYLEVAAVMLDEKTSSKRAALIRQGMKEGGIDLSIYPQLF